MLTVAIALVSATTAFAGSHDHNRGGFFVGFGLGGGSATLDSDIDSEAGGMGMFRIGWAMDNNLTIGLETSAWTKEVDGATVTFSVVGPGVTFYPGNSGFFVKGAIGAGTLEAEFDLGAGKLTASESGLGILAALGWEARLTNKFALGVEGSGSFLDVSDELSGTKFIGANLIFNWYWSDPE